MQGHASFLNRIALAALDALLLTASLLAAFYIRFDSGLIAAPLGVPPFASYLPSFFFALFLAAVLFDTHRLYGERARLSRLDEILRLARATTFVFLALMGAGFFYRDVSFSRVWLALAWGLSVVSLSTGRLAVRSIEAARYRRGLGVRRVAIAGTGE